MTPPSDAPAVTPEGPPYPSPADYPVQELMEELHHLLQPILGFRRYAEKDFPTERGQYEIERLQLALGLANIASGIAPWKDVDVRALRARHGCGSFEVEKMAALTGTSLPSADAP